jgi:anaerobic glycerol-3-phosphate dehydrogenase B subunit
MAAEANLASARAHGGEALNYCEVVGLLRSGDRVAGARCHDLVGDETVEITADLVVNAAGAWAGKLAEQAGIQVRILPGKGTMIALNHRPVDTILNRCKMPSDGDIIVPIHTVAVIGTTDIQIPDPDRIAIEPWEIELMLAEGEKMIPGLRQMRILRAWAGVRPLYQETSVAESREISRAYVLLDHLQRDGLAGLVTITSGKWTTYRLMAEATVDLVCAQLGVQRACRTHLEPLPGAAGGYHHKGARLAQVERSEDYDDPVCECELASRAEIVAAITSSQARTLDDVRREARLGMGPCQGGFCTYRAAGILQALRQPPVEEINVALRDFLQERWKGLLPILWGGQLRQERLDELIYLSVLNADHLPGPGASRLAAEMYEPAAGRRPQRAGEETTADGRPLAASSLLPYSPTPLPPGSAVSRNTELQSLAGGLRSDVLVIGAGLAGLVAGWQAAAAGRRVQVIAKGWGATHWQAGCVDVLGYFPADPANPVQSPLEALAQLALEQAHHPYAIAGQEQVAKALETFQSLCRAAGYPLHGSLDRNWLLPSALGTLRPTCLAPETMIAGDLRRRDPLLIVGFEQFRDFYPGLIAANLSRQGFLANELVLDLPCLRTRRFIDPSILAQQFETDEFRDEVVAALAGRLGQSRRVGFPAVLGLRNALAVKRDLEARLGVEVFEIPGLPPSIPGIRLHDLLLAAIESAGGRVTNGMLAVAAEGQAGRIAAVWTEAAARRLPHRAETYILATGGFLSGGLAGEESGALRETVFNLPFAAPAGREVWFNRDFLDPSGHPVFRAGLRVDSAFRPLDRTGQAAWSNLHAVGAVLAGGDFLRERSLDGVALATGFAVGRLISHGQEF